MNSKKILEAKKAIENLIDNWLDDEEACYLENLEYLLKNNKYKDCEYHKELYNSYHKELYNDKIKLSNIPTSKLCKGFNYTDLRILEDFFDSHKMFYEESDNEKIKDILWEYISEKDIPEIEKRIKNEN